MADPRERAASGLAGFDARVLPRRSGLQFPSALPYETWQRVGCQLGLVSDSSSWWLGDWLVFGENRYPDRYQRAVASSSLDHKTLRNYAWVARRVPYHRRLDGLSMSHHAEVAGLPEHDQDLWLERAEANRWSRNRLRREIQMASKAGPSSSASRTAMGHGVIQMRISIEERDRWSDAARLADHDLTTWIRSLVDRELSALSAPDDHRSLTGGG